MAKLTLDLEESYDFELIGICSHVKDYRLSWALNQKFEFDLEKDENLELKYKGELQSFSFFSFKDEENLIEYYLLQNRSTNGLLIPEEKKADYFLMIQGVYRSQEKIELIKEITQLKCVLTAYDIDVEQLKSKENLLF